MVNHESELKRVLEKALKNALENGTGVTRVSMGNMGQIQLNSITKKQFLNQLRLKAMDLPLEALLDREGYTHIRFIDGWGYCGIQRMMYNHHDVCVGLDETGMVGRLRFEDLTAAIRFISHWSGSVRTIPDVGQNGLLENKLNYKPNEYKPTDLGATGDFPDGKLNEYDEGAVKLAIGNNDGHVIIDFGTPVVWMGLKPNEAVSMAQSLIKQARALANETGEVLEVKL